MPRTQKSLNNNLTTLTTSSGSTSKRKNVTSKTPLIKGSKDKELFPHLNRFTYAFIPGKKHEDHLNKAWFDDLDRIQAWIRKHKLKQDEYLAYHYTGKK